MNELTLDGKTYVSSKRAAEITGYAKDYVGQLCREGRIEARLVGRNWYVLEEAIKEHRFAKDSSEQSEKPELQAKEEDPIVWNSPKYTPDIPVSIPALGINRIHEESSVRKTIVVNDMQRAWQDWFSRKEVIETKNIESGAEVVSESVPVETEFASTGLDYTEVAEDTVSVPIRHLEDSRVSVREEVAFADDKSREEVEVIRTKKKRTRSTSLGTHSFRNSLVRILFAIVILVSIVMGLIGTGYVEEMYGFNVKNIPVLNYIAGIYSLDN